VAVAYDPLVQQEPYAPYRALRRDFPVYRNEERGFWALSRFEDVQRAAREWRCWSSAEGVNLDDTLSLTGRGNFIAADPPDHDRLRRVVRERFTPATIAAMEPAIRADVRATLRTAIRAGGLDAAAALAWAIPVRTVSRALGVPLQDAPVLRAWLRAAIARDPGSDRLPAGARAAAESLRAYFVDRVARADGGLLADVATARREREIASEEVPGLCVLLFIAGTETVADFIGNALIALAEHPEQRALLAAEPERMPAAAEELLRFESPVQYQLRTATKDTELHGTTLPEGAAVALLWGAANRDERRLERPDELDLARAPRRNLAFGEGIHHCLGAPLARLQGRLVLEEVLAAMPGYRVAGEPERIATHNTRGVARLAILPA
jgi:cytochrome P450